MGHVSNKILVNDSYCETVRDFDNDHEFSIHSARDQHYAPPYTLQDEVSNERFEFLLDSGAACSLMSRETFGNLFKKLN